MAMTVRPMPGQALPRTVEKRVRCDTATIGHFENETFVSSDIRAVIPGARSFPFASNEFFQLHLMKLGGAEMARAGMRARRSR